MTATARALAELSGSRGPWVWIGVAAAVLALIPAGLRWLRVAQREHYLAGSCVRFGWRWWTGSPDSLALGLLAVAALVVSAFWAWGALGVALAVTLGPFRLKVKGRTSPLAFTRRLRVLAAVWLVLQAIVVGLGFLLGAPALFAAAGALLAPALLDAACALVAPVEGHLAARFVESAQARLLLVAPTLVGITGSYGKTSTKNHLLHLVTGSRPVVASPASYNNRAGLARAVNEHLVEGTEVFIAEMGTYGPGEIAALCAWCPPEIAVITAIGPVHLERFRSLERTLAAKSEITVPASVVVLNVDDPRLAALAERLAAGPHDESGVGSDVGPGAGPGRKTVVRCSAVDEQADICVRRQGRRQSVWVGGRAVAEHVACAGVGQPTNLACALGVALALGVPEDVAVARLMEVPGVPNRLTSAVAPSGVRIFDDTFNANPAGAAAALEALAGVEPAPGSGRRVVVTPGMIELGPVQAEENCRFAAAAAEVATDLVVVGRTNRRALRRGAGIRPTVLVEQREQAVDWVRANLGPGDVVLYENDLPDHYP